MSIRYLLLSFPAFLGASASNEQREQQILQPTFSTTTQAVPPSKLYGYSYIGCWNETTGFDSTAGARALAEGRHVRSTRPNGILKDKPLITQTDTANQQGSQYNHTTMTISLCLHHCSTQATQYTYAGLQDGSRCYCSTALSPLSEKVHESSRCTTPCAGNVSEVCGGATALTLYNITSAIVEETGVGWSQFSGVVGYGTLAFVMFVLAAVM